MNREEFEEEMKANSWPMGEPTLLDAIARLTRFDAIHDLGDWADRLPNHIKTDDRFAKAVKQRLAEINHKGAPRVLTQ